MKLSHAVPTEMGNLVDDQVHGFVVRPVVVRKNPYVAELAQKRASARDFDHGAVITPHRRIQKGTVHGAGAGNLEAFPAPQNGGYRPSHPESFQKLLDGVFAVPDEDMVEHGQALYDASLVQRPADRPADHECRRRETAAQLVVDFDQGRVILVDPAEQENVDVGERRDVVEATVEKFEREPPVFGNMRRERIGPDRHEFGAVTLRLRTERVRRMHKDAVKRIASSDRGHGIPILWGGRHLRCGPDRHGETSAAGNAGGAAGAGGGRGRDRIGGS